MSRELAELLKLEGIDNSAVLRAVAMVPREQFVSPQLKKLAYIDESLPIGHEQTISQPFVVARMTELLLQQHPCKRVLEIGTGSGYQAAILAQLVEEVYTVERIRPLYEQAKQRFQQLGYTNIHLLLADGNLGWKEHSPYDGIIVTAAALNIPPALPLQLAEGGRLIIPVGPHYQLQELCRITRHDKQFPQEWYDSVIFVPLRAGIAED